MIHTRLNILALLYADLTTKRAMHDVADACRDQWPTTNAAWLTASETASAAFASVTEAEAMIREQCSRDGLDAATLRGLAELLDNTRVLTGFPVDELGKGMGF